MNLSILDDADWIDRRVKFAILKKSVVSGGSLSKEEGGRSDFSSLGGFV